MFPKEDTLPQQLLLQNGKSCRILWQIITSPWFGLEDQILQEREHGSGLILAPGSSPIGCQITQVIKVDKIVFYTLAALDGTTSIAT